MGILEVECSAFWHNARRLRLTVQNDDQRTDTLDDIDLMRQYTEHPGLRARCDEILLAGTALEVAV